MKMRTSMKMKIPMRSSQLTLPTTTRTTRTTTTTTTTRTTTGRTKANTKRIWFILHNFCCYLEPLSLIGFIVDCWQRQLDNNNNKNNKTTATTTGQEDTLDNKNNKRATTKQFAMTFKSVRNEKERENNMKTDRKWVNDREREWESKRKRVIERISWRKREKNAKI